MKKICHVLAAAALAISATPALASGKKITCQLSINTADRSGYLMPSEETITVSGKVAEGNMLARGLDAFMASCSNVQAKGLTLKLCSSSTDFVGLYDVGVLLENSGVTTAATALMGTLKSNGKSLDIINSTVAVSPEIVSRLSNANIEVPTEMQGDSVAVDDALEAASRKGLIKGDEIATVGIQGCAID